MVDTEAKENFRLSKEAIFSELTKSKYGNRYECCSTYLEQNAVRWRRGKHSDFEKSLMGMKYFAYIKFYLDDDVMYALVAGKSGSRRVNGSGSDVRFREYPYKGKAKAWLYEQKKQWCKTEILVIPAIAEEDEENKNEALEIERYLVKTFGLFQS